MSTEHRQAARAVHNVLSERKAIENLVYELGHAQEVYDLSLSEAVAKVVQTQPADMVSVTRVMENGTVEFKIARIAG